MSKLLILFQLLKRDLVGLKRQYLPKLFDTALLLVVQIILFGYIMSPQLGENYGVFLFIGAIACYGFFDIVSKVWGLITDIEGDRKISYILTMPIPSWLVFVYYAANWALHSTAVTLLLFPIGKLILYNQFDLSTISLLRLIPMFLTMNLFYGIFSLWISSLFKKSTDLDGLWLRVINPLISFGAQFYSWYALKNLFPPLAYVTLLNPIVYVMEGMRAATLGQEGYIPFWVCISMVWVFILACGWHAIRRLQRRLDCVR